MFEATERPGQPDPSGRRKEDIAAPETPKIDPRFEALAQKRTALQKLEEAPKDTPEYAQQRAALRAEIILSEIHTPTRGKELSLVSNNNLETWAGDVETLKLIVDSLSQAKNGRDLAYLLVRGISVSQEVLETISPETRKACLAFLRSTEATDMFQGATRELIATTANVMRKSRGMLAVPFVQEVPTVLAKQSTTEIGDFSEVLEAAKLSPSEVIQNLNDVDQYAPFEQRPESLAALVRIVDWVNFSVEDVKELSDALLRKGAEISMEQFMQIYGESEATSETTDAYNGTQKYLQEAAEIKNRTILAEELESTAEEVQLALEDFCTYPLEPNQPTTESSFRTDEFSLQSLFGEWQNGSRRGEIGKVFRDRLATVRKIVRENTSYEGGTFNAQETTEDRSIEAVSFTDEQPELKQVVDKINEAKKTAIERETQKKASVKAAESKIDYHRQKYEALMDAVRAWADLLKKAKSIPKDDPLPSVTDLDRNAAQNVQLFEKLEKDRTGRRDSVRWSQETGESIAKSVMFGLDMDPYIKEFDEAERSHKVILERAPRQIAAIELQAEKRKLALAQSYVEQHRSNFPTLQTDERIIPVAERRNEFNRLNNELREKLKAKWENPEKLIPVSEAAQKIADLVVENLPTMTSAILDEDGQKILAREINSALERYANIIDRQPATIPLFPSKPNEKAALLIRKGGMADSRTGEAQYLHLGLAGQKYADQQTNGMEGMLAVVIEQNSMSRALSIRFSPGASSGANPWNQEYQITQSKLEEEAAKKLLAEVDVAA